VYISRNQKEKERLKDTNKKKWAEKSGITRSFIIIICNVIKYMERNIQ